MKTLVLSIGGKGGVGKTLGLVTLANWLQGQGKGFAALDCDQENRGKASSFANFIKEAATPDLRNIGDCDKLLTVAAESEAEITLADLPANAGGDFHGWFASVVNQETLAALQLRIVAVGALTPEPATAASVFEWAQKLQDQVSYVLILNRRKLERAQLSKELLFPEYFGSKTGQNFRKTFKPAEVEIHGLYDASMGQLLRSAILPHELITNGDAVPILDRQRILSWSRAVDAQWSAVRETLGV